MVGPNLLDTQLQQVVNRTILYADDNVDGKISFSEFCNLIGDSTDIGNMLKTHHV